MQVSTDWYKHIALLLVTLCVFSPSRLLASSHDVSTTGDGFPALQSSVYGEIQLGAAGVRHSDLDFYPFFGSLSAGIFVVPNIGIELFVDGGLADEDNAGFDMELSSAHGIAARFQSPPRAGLSGYIVLGVANYTLTQTQRNAAAGNGKIEEDFRGARVSIGVTQQLQRVPALAVSAEYRSYITDDPIKVDSLVFGLRITP